jgi:hypothetical protein
VFAVLWSKLFQVAFLEQSLTGAYHESLFDAGSRRKSHCD